MSLPPKQFRWRYIMYIIVICFGFFYAFIWLRPPVVFFTESDRISSECVYDIKARFWIRYDNPLGRGYTFLLVRKIEVLENENIQIYGWFNNILWKEKISIGGENNCLL